MEEIKRQYPEIPLVGVAGVVVKDGQILLIQRGTPPGKGEWNLPGGLVEIGERLVEAVKREVWEETGLEVQVETLLDVSDRIIRDGRGRVRYHYVLHDYLCRHVTGVAAAHSDAMEVKWVTFQEVFSFHLPEAVRDVLVKAIKWVEKHE
jgi:ADP-ribose pyrophosphatase YjhB (NUDIX family)